MSGSAPFGGNLPDGLALLVRRVAGGLDFQPTGGEQGSGRRSLDIGARLDPPRDCPLVAHYRIPLRQQLGEDDVALVRAGQRVRRGDVLADARGRVTAPLHAPTSGRIVGIERCELADAVDREGPCIVLEADGDDAAGAMLEPLEDALNADPAALRRRARDAGLVGLGGAAFPTAAKLDAAVEIGVDTLIVNGAECDPWLGCDRTLMRFDAARIVSGARLLRQASEAQQCLIALEEDESEAIAAMAEAIAAAGDERVRLVTVPERYPAGGERQLVTALLGREVPSEGLPLHVGAICQNVATAAALHDAAVEGRPLIERVVSVTGPGVAGAGAFRVRIGTPVARLVEAVGGYTPAVTRLVMGGVMMGIALASDDVPVTKATNGLVALTGSAARGGDTQHPCIRCGFCAEVCPAALQPQELHRHLASLRPDVARAGGVLDCIECGCCDTVCPSAIPLTEAFREAKRSLWLEDAQRLRADGWREQYRRHQLRLASGEREAAARAARRSSRRAGEAAEREPPGGVEARTATAQPPYESTQISAAAVGPGETSQDAEAARQAVIQAAVARARARRARERPPDGAAADTPDDDGGAGDGGDD